MPILLPQLPRRKFLKRVALASAAIALAPASQAGWFGKSRDKHTFFFLSDTHISMDATFKDKSGVNVTDNLTACLRQLAEWPVKPAQLIVNGDLALKEGLAADYLAFAKILEPARALAPVHLNLGNHDSHTTFWAALMEDAAQTSALPQKQVAIIESPRANWFLLDSLETTNVADGAIGQLQLNWLNDELAKRRDKPAILVGHHNLKSAQNTSGLNDSNEFAALFMQHPQIKAFIFGHTHDWNISQHPSGVHLVNLPPTGYVFKAGRPSGWVRCTLAKDGAEFELRALDAQHPEHAQVKQLEWRA